MRVSFKKYFFFHSLSLVYPYHSMTRVLSHHNNTMIQQHPTMDKKKQKKQQDKRENFVNLMDLHKDSLYTDFVLLICDEADPLRQPKFEIATHRFILYACSTYFARCFTFGQQQASSIVLSSMCLALNFVDGLTEEMVRLFFRLFYVTRFDAQHLLAEEGLMDAIEANIFFLYQLALRFHFNPLIEYCESLLFESWGLEYFGHLSRFCLIKNGVTGRYAIIDERLKLYARFLQWYQCCVEQLPTYAPLLSDDASSRHYFSCQKEEIMRELIANVDNIEACHIPTKSHRNVSATAMQLTYYRKICTACLFNSNTKHSYEGFYLINFGALKKYYLNGYEQYFFRLKRRLRNNDPLTDNMLELSLLRTYEEPRDMTSSNNDETHHTPKHANRRHSATRIRLIIQENEKDVYDESISVEEEEEVEEIEIEEMIAANNTILDDKAQLEQMPLLASMTDTKYRCQSHITLLSKKVDTDQTPSTYASRDFALPTEISHFELHHEKWCYTGQCDSCAKQAPIYIIQMDIRLERDTPSLF